MTIESVVREREITEVLHFTSNRGLLGCLHKGYVLSRERLPDDLDLQFIYKPNAKVRKDIEWLDYINLSISSINVEFFEHACRWHREQDLWWCIMSFSPELLSVPGVFFGTTNNIYTGVKRAGGVDGLNSLFAPSIARWGGNTVRRSPLIKSSDPTCPQAEVLYPGALSINYLKKIYVSTISDKDEVEAQLVATRRSATVEVRSDLFGFES